jgi:hypothetical protein
MARRTGDLESRAKDQRGADGRPQKDSVALFGAVTEGRSLAEFERHTPIYGWDVFIDHVCGEKLAFLRANCIFEEGAKGEQLSLGKSAVYRLLTLLEQDGQIQLARFAYALARLDPGAQSPAQEAYARVRTQLYEWYRDPAERRQLSTAFQLIIYSIREKGEGSNG